MDEYTVNENSHLNSAPGGDEDDGRGVAVLMALRSLRLPAGLRGKNRARIGGAMERARSHREEGAPPRERRRAALLFGLAAGLAVAVLAGLLSVAALRDPGEKGPSHPAGGNGTLSPAVVAAPGSQGTESDGGTGGLAPPASPSPDQGEEGLEIATASLTPTTTSGPKKAGSRESSPAMPNRANGSGRSSVVAPSPLIVTPTETPRPTVGAQGGDLSLGDVVAGQANGNGGGETVHAPDSNRFPTPVPAGLPPPGLPSGNLCQASTAGGFLRGARM